jgi:hypothetical protein
MVLSLSLIIPAIAMGTPQLKHTWVPAGKSEAQLGQLINPAA